MGWECVCPRSSTDHDYEYAIYGMRNVLRKHSLVGYHCTKLTTSEVEIIRKKGMFLQNFSSLKGRISQLEKDGLLSSEVAKSLISKNQSDDKNRANMLWFCFYEPYLAGRYGIERFFRSWGGEALYSSHENHPVTGKTIQRIGNPCVVKAHVTIESLKESYYPDTSMIRVFLSQKGHRIESEIEHEGFSTRAIDSQNVVEIFEYPSEQFDEITGCKEWVDGDKVL